MGCLYASPVGISVLQLSFIPPAPKRNARGLWGGPSPADLEYNPREYEVRGWCIFESAVASTTSAHCDSIGHLVPQEAVPKLRRLSSDGTVSVLERKETVGLHELTTVRLAGATFTGKGDRDKVKDLYKKFAIQVGKL
eukprot:4648922-Prymnesium_polylepis.1